MHGIIRQALAAVLAVAMVASMAVGPVAANHNEDFFDGLTESDSDDDGGVTAWVGERAASATGWVARATADLPLVGDSETGNATTYADAFQESFNSQNETIQRYANQRLDATSGYDVFRVYFHDKSGHNVSRVVVAEVNDGNWSQARVVDPGTFQGEMNRNVDYEIHADWYVSRHAADELDSFVAEYASENETIPRSKKVSLVAEYGSGLESEMWNTTTEDA